MDGEDQGRQPTIETWQAIAAYLGVAKRTAQNYERSQGLPVYRLKGDKSRVWAYPEELDAWREQFRQILAESSSPGNASVGKEQRNSKSSAAANGLALPGDAVVGQEKSTATPISDMPATGRASRRHWLRYAMTAAAGLGVGAAAVKMPGLFRLNRQPATYRIDGARLTVLDPDDVVLWRHTFPRPMPLEWYRENPDLYCRFEDLDGTGHISTLFYYRPADLVSEQYLACFDSIGRLRWKFVAGREVVDNLGRTFDRPYGLTAFAVVRSKDSKSAQVVISSVHNSSFPCQVALLESRTGNLIGEYWHRGHLTTLAVADLDHDGHPKILIGGVNDALDYKCATLKVFDHRRIAGACCDPHGQPYFRGTARGTETWTIYFPKTPVSMRQEFNRVFSVMVFGGRIRLMVDEGINHTYSGVIYEFDYNLRPLNVTLSGELAALHRQLQDAGKIAFESPYAIAERMMRQIRVVKES